MSDRCVARAGSTLPPRARAERSSRETRRGCRWSCAWTDSGPRRRPYKRLRTAFIAARGRDCPEAAELGAREERELAQARCHGWKAGDVNALTGGFGYEG